MAINTLSVGAPFDPAIPTWPEGSHYSATGHHRLVVFLARPSAAEVAALRAGDARFALLDRGSVIVLCYRFDPALPWSDAPYSVHLEGGHHDLAKLPTSSSRYTLTVIGVDAETGLVVSIREVSLSPAFSRALRKSCDSQEMWPITRAEYDRKLATLAATMPTLVMVARASVTCRGGE